MAVESMARVSETATASDTAASARPAPVPPRPVLPAEILMRAWIDEHLAAQDRTCTTVARAARSRQIGPQDVLLSLARLLGMSAQEAAVLVIGPRVSGNVVQKRWYRLARKLGTPHTELARLQVFHS